MEYELFVKQEMFKETFTEEYSNVEGGSVIIHQLCLLCIHRPEKNVQGLLMVIAKNTGAGFEERSQVLGNIFNECNQKKELIMNSDIARLFTEMFLLLKRLEDISSHIFTYSDLEKIASRLKITIIFLESTKEKFVKKVFYYGATVAVISFRNKQYHSINSVHLTGEFDNDPECWPISWSPSLPKDSIFIKKTIRKMCLHRNFIQSLFYKIQDLYFAYPWLEDTFYEWIEAYVSISKTSVYNRILEAPRSEISYCNLCKARENIKHVCLSCILKKKQYAKLLSQLCNSCGKPIETLEICIVDARIFHMKCTPLTP